MQVTWAGVLEWGWYSWEIPMDHRRQTLWYRSAFHIPQQVQKHRTGMRKAPDRAGSLTLTYSSPSSNSVSLCTTTLVTDMSGCCSLASLMAWASACQGQERALSAEEEDPSQVGASMHTDHQGFPLKPRWFYCFIWGSRKIWNVLVFILENAPHFFSPQFSCPFWIIIHVEETSWF